MNLHTAITGLDTVRNYIYALMLGVVTYVTLPITVSTLQSGGWYIVLGILYTVVFGLLAITGATLTISGTVRAISSGRWLSIVLYLILLVGWLLAFLHGFGVV